MVTVLTVKARPLVRAPIHKGAASHQVEPPAAPPSWGQGRVAETDLEEVRNTGQAPRCAGVRPQGHFRDVQDQAGGCRPGASWSAWPSGMLLRQWAGAGRGHPGVPSPPTPGSSLCFPWGPPWRLHRRGHRCQASCVMAGHGLPSPWEQGPRGPMGGEAGRAVPVKTFPMCAPPLPLRISSRAALQSQSKTPSGH